MAHTSDEGCPHCHKDIHLPMRDYVEGKVIVCPRCGGRSELRKAPSPSAENLGAKAWHLIPLATDS